MNLHLELRPFTDFRNPDTLATQLSEIVRKPINHRLVVDFPNIWDLYGDTGQAKRTVAQRRAEMAINPQFAALAVILGQDKATARVCGVTTMLVRRICGPRLTRGTHTAMWLDGDREPELREVGPALLLHRLEWALDHPEFTGPLWTVIRTGNRRSRYVWERPIYPMTLARVGRPHAYRRLDGVREQRQLYRSLLTLEQARALAEL